MSVATCTSVLLALFVIVRGEAPSEPPRELETVEQPARPAAGKVLDDWDAIAATAADDPSRSARLATLLEAGQGALEGSRLRLAWEIGVEASLGQRFEEALVIQRYLFDWHPADWSAMDLALTLGKLERPAEADAVLAEAIGLERAAGRFTGELWNRRGLLALGLDDERRARDHFGRALARGSGDAAVVLARMDLERGSFERARAGFRSQLYDETPSAWAQRGWGLALLPDHTPPGSGDDLPAARR